MGTPVDDLLRQFIECNDAARAESMLEELVTGHALPGIRRVVRYKLAFQGRAEAQDIEDVSSDVMLELLGRLREMKAKPAEELIGSFAGYTAVAAYHACNEYLRRKYPNRHRLKTRLRYLLNHDARFAIWDNGFATWLCGVQEWRRDEAACALAESVGNARELLADLPRGPNASHPAELLVEIFRRFGAPVGFDDLVGIVAFLWGVDDPVAAPEHSARDVESGEIDPVHRLELSRWLTELWVQIRELPRSQRVALLLNLRAGDSTPALAMLPLTGIAGMGEIGEVLGFGVEEFTVLWNRLPLEDLAIAELLGVTRQQVINLRKSARERLTRRIGGKYRLS